MNNEPSFASLGKEKSSIDVRLSYRIIELFSEGLYTSPNKALEELVANSFDAGAQNVHVILSPTPNMHAQDATIVVIDDGEGMDDEGLQQHWLIGISNKRKLPSLPRGRKQIGKFGIGKLATYVLANRLTHISKKGGKYYSTSMDYSNIDKRFGAEVEPKAPIKIALRELKCEEAKNAVQQWTDLNSFREAKWALFGDNSPSSWTVSIMSSLKDKSHEITPGRLNWVLRTALPLRPDFSIWLNSEKLAASREGVGRIGRWILGKDLIDLPKPSPKNIEKSGDMNVTGDDRFGLDVPELGRITGYAEAYKDMLTTGKSAELGRSHGFFVYVYGRLLNVADGHFGISPDELRHGSFGRFRLVVHMDGLDSELRSNRESVSDGPLLETAKNVLRGIFNAVRPKIERYDEQEEPGANLSRRLANSPASLSRTPITKLSKTVLEGRCKSRYLIVSPCQSEEQRQEYLESLDQRLSESGNPIANVSIDFNGSSKDGIAKFDTATGSLLFNGWHPFVAVFHDELTSKKTKLLFELLAMAEVIAEAQFYALDLKQKDIDEILDRRDQLLRYLVNESGRKSALSIANELSEARNNPKRLEECTCDAFRSLGFDVRTLGWSGKPDGIAEAHLSADDTKTPQRYKVSLEAKSKQNPARRVSAERGNIAAIIRHRQEHTCEHAIVVAPAFPDSDAWKKSIADDRQKSGATITLITIDTLARLVRLRPVRRIGLRKIRELFQECSLHGDSENWVNSMNDMIVEDPDYRKIVETISNLQKRFVNERVTYGALRVELSNQEPPIQYETDDELAEVCKAMAQVAPGAIFATQDKVELDQSPENVIASLEAAFQEYPSNEQTLNKRK